VVTVPPAGTDWVTLSSGIGVGEGVTGGSVGFGDGDGVWPGGVGLAVGVSVGEAVGEAVGVGVCPVGVGEGVFVGVGEGECVGVGVQVLFKLADHWRKPVSQFGSWYLRVPSAVVYVGKVPLIDSSVVLWYS
jgi:hypothetical protein